MKTKKIRARTLLCVILALVIALGSVSVVSAEAIIVDLGVVRLSGTSGSISAAAEFNQLVTTCSAKITLQEKYNNSWRTATGVPTHTLTRSDKNTDYLYLAHTLTLVEGKLYRIKATFTDTIGSTTDITTCYSTVF